MKRPAPSIGSVSIVLAIAVFGLILGPYLTVWLPFRRSLEARAVLVLVFTSIPLVVGLRQKGWLQRILEAPRPILIGVALWAGAAGMGTVVGLFRGNEPILVIGQLFSMALLPYAFVAARSFDARHRRQTFAIALVGAVLVACFLHFGHWWLRAAAQKPLLRLYMPNGISVVGASLMTLIVALSLVVWKKGTARIFGLVGVSVVGLYVLGSGTRSLMPATALGLAIFLMAWGGYRWGAKGLITGALVVVALILSSFLTLQVAWNAPRRDVLPQESFFEPFWMRPSGGEVVVVDGPGGVGMEIVWGAEGQPLIDWVSLPYPINPRGVHRLSVEMMGEGTGTGLIDFVFLIPSLDDCTHRTFRVEAGAGWQLLESTLPTELEGGASVVRIRVGSEGEARGTWRARNVRMEQYSDIVPRPVQRILVFLYDRIANALKMIREGKLSQDPSMRVRLKETAAVFDQVEKASVPTEIFGHGLGARLEFEEWGFNSVSEETVIKNPNYMHNFFAFLALKLGLLGGLSILAALILWIHQSAQMIFHRTRHGGVGPGAASLAVWFAYIAWSVFCPQFIDFGDAPLFGFFLACWMAENHEITPGSTTD